MEAISLPSWCRPLVPVGTVQDRALGIGGTDIAAICGISPWATAFDVWLDKKGNAPKKEATQAMTWGNRAEPIIASAYADETGSRIMKVGVTLAGKVYPWLIGSPDYLLSEKPQGLDCKNIRFKDEKWGEPGSDKVPEYYLTQAQWYMILTGAQSWDIPALFGGCDLQIFTVGHSDRLASALIERAEEFWTRYVVGSEEPEIQDSPKVRAWIKDRFKSNVKPLRPATAEEREIALALKTAKADAKAAEEYEASLATKLKIAIADADGLEFAEGKVTWRQDKDSTAEVTDWQGIARELAQGNPEILARLEAEHKKTVVTRKGARKLLVTVKETES